jgi:inositol-phosphate phosphatase/L-galactose 1-phosphate phosphatase
MSSDHFKERLDIAREAARKAGDIIRNSTKMIVSTKSSNCDLVTQVDQLAEQIIVQHISQHFPNDIIIGEERSSQSTSYHDLEGQSIPDHLNIGCWFIDPLDGTSNFVHGYPLVNVSIGCCFGGIPRLGIIFNPFLDEMYEAMEGQGAYRNGKRISVDASTGLHDCLLVNNIGHERQKEFVEESTERIAKWLHGGLRGYRSSGSAAQNMGHVASGQVSCYFEHLYGGPWDVCAGYVIVKEAGGVLMDPKDESMFQLRYGKGSICCGNEQVVKEVLRVAGRPKFI